jgi:hypothetical protein
LSEEGDGFGEVAGKVELDEEMGNPKTLQNTRNQLISEAL